MEPLTLRASLQSVKTRKDLSDDIVQKIELTVYGTAAQMGVLNAPYKVPIKVTIETVEE